MSIKDKELNELLQKHVKIYANDVFKEDIIAKKKFIDFYNQPNIESNKSSLLNFRSVGKKNPSFYIDENYNDTKVIDINIIDEVNMYRKEFENEIKESEKTKDNNEDLTSVNKSKSINTQASNNIQLVKNLSSLGKIYK
jgi:hypothetical protein